MPIKTPRLIALFLIAAVFSLVSVAGQSQNSSTVPADVQTQLDALRAEGYEALYNLDYEGARRRFLKMIELAPDHPVGPQCFAASLWLQQLNESWELKATLYSTKAYTDGKDRVNPNQAAEFRKWTSLAKRLSEARLRRNQRDVEALYFLGAAQGLESVFAAAVERKFMAALRSGSDAVDHHREVLALAPGFRDAELTIGLQNYVIGSLPLPLKLLAGTQGVRGSKKRGLETLERVSVEGDWARDLARVLLVDLYKREKRWNEAVAMARQLSERYPRNYLFKLQMTDGLVSQILARQPKSATASSVSAEEKELVAIFDSLLHDRTLAPSTLDLVHFRYGEALLSLAQPYPASREFRAVVARTNAESELRTMSRLRVAQSLDLLGKRSEALTEYRAVLLGPDGNHAHEEARRGLREPYHSSNLRNRE